MKQGIRQYIATALAWAALVALFAAAVMKTGHAPYGLFDDWLGTGAHDGLSPASVRYMFKVQYYFLGCLAAFFLLLLRPLRPPAVVWLIAGVLILVLWLFAPPFLTLTSADETGERWISLYLCFVRFPNPLAVVLGIGCLAAASPFPIKMIRQSLAGAFAFCWIAIPLTRVFWPDFYFEGDVRGMLALFVLVIAVFMAACYMVIPFFWPQFSDFTGFGPTLEDVSPARGKTVREIREGGLEPPAKRFLFGRSDEELVRRWGMIGQALVAVSSTRRRRFATLAIVLLAWPLFVFAVSGGPGGAFRRDVDAMWETTTREDGLVVATPRAMSAAKRVFADEYRFRGLNNIEIAGVLHMERMDPRYTLNRPLQRIDEDTFMLRIGNGEDSMALHLAYNTDGKAVVVWGKDELYPVPVGGASRR